MQVFFFFQLEKTSTTVSTRLELKEFDAAKHHTALLHDGTRGAAKNIEQRQDLLLFCIIDA